MDTVTRRISRRRALLAGVGIGVTGLLWACAPAATTPKPEAGKPAPPTPAAAAPQPTAAAPAQAQAGDLNDRGWPRSIDKLTMGFIPLEDAVQQKSQIKAFTDYVSSRIGVPADANITTSYAALVEAQRGGQTVIGYYGALSFLLAEQQFGAVPIMVDSEDGKTPGKYNSYLLAGKDSPVKTAADIRGKDFSFVDPASTSGNLFPRVMLIEEGIDPNKDVRGRYAGNHQNSILAIAKGQVPCGASNNLSVDSAVSKGVIARDDLAILKVSPDIPNGPFAVSPDLDPRAVTKIQEVFGEFEDTTVLKGMELVGPLIPTDTSAYDFVRRAARTINLQFDDKGQPKPIE